MIRKILKQQNHLKIHLNRLEKESPTTQIEAVREPGERHLIGKGYILKTFLNNVADSAQDHSRDSGIGSALPTNTDFSIITKDENNLQSLETISDGHQRKELSQHDRSVDQLDDLIQEYEKIVMVNEKLNGSENQIQMLIDAIDDVTIDENKQEVEDLYTKSEMASLRSEIENIIQVNSKMSHDIKKNDVSISHMVKNFDGRESFLKTIELDINRAESFGKRLQIEFQREYETVGLFQNIISDSEEAETKEEITQCNTLITASDENDVDAADANENIELLPSDLLNTSFTISATQNPFGI